MNKELLDIYTDFLISQNHYATATGLSAMVDGEISHDKINSLPGKRKALNMQAERRNHQPKLFELKAITFFLRLSLM